MRLAETLRYVKYNLSAVLYKAQKEGLRFIYSAKSRYSQVVERVRARHRQCPKEKQHIALTWQLQARNFLLRLLVHDQAIGKNSSCGQREVYLYIQANSPAPTQKRLSLLCLWLMVMQGCDDFLPYTLKMPLSPEIYDAPPGHSEAARNLGA